MRDHPCGSSRMLPPAGSTIVMCDRAWPACELERLRKRSRPLRFDSQVALLDRRERGGQQDLGRLLDDRAVAWRWPDALCGSLLAYGNPLVEALVGPDVHPLV